MELKNEYMIYVGIIILLFMLIAKRKRKDDYKEGKKIIGISPLENNPYFKRRRKIYKALWLIMRVAYIGAALSCVVLIARPYETLIDNEETNNRDIILCMDVSSSVDELNLRLVEQLKETVQKLKGERFGIVVFNTSPVLLCPLTQDYEYVCDVLDQIKEGLEINLEDYSDVFSYHNSSEYLWEGTIVGAQTRGSSLIGDGLASSVYNFDEDDNRTKLVIFSTDNDLQGEPFVTLSQAADICIDNKVKVFGVGTELMNSKDEKEMKKAVEKTGGNFYRQEDNQTVSDIVKKIEKTAKSMSKGKTIVIEHELPTVAALSLAICIILILIISIILNPYNRRISRIIAYATMLALTITIVMRPRIYDRVDAAERKLKANVLFVIDNTISMLANDYDKKSTKETRLDGVKQDCYEIIKQLEGANFSVVSFDNKTKQNIPFTQDSNIVNNSIKAMYPISSYYARGTSMNDVRDKLNEVLKSCEKSDYPTVVFFVSDGEITNGDKLKSFSDMSKYIDYGAVLGYGTNKGGTMTQRDSFGEEKLIPDYNADNNVAISKIDEDNLKAIAKDLDVKYIHMEKGHNIDNVIENIKKKAMADEEETKGNGYRELYYWFSIPLLVMIMVMYIIKAMPVRRKRA